MNLADVFRQQISFKEPAGTRGAHGDPDYATAQLQTAPARVEASSRFIGTPSGEQVEASHFVMTTQKLSVFAKVWLPGADTADLQAGRRPLRVDECVDLDGVVTHYEVYF